MGIDKKQVDDFEKKYKDTLFSRIDEIRLNEFQVIDQIATNATNIGQLNVDIPNTSTTLNNKLVELSHIFKKAGLSMYVKEFEDYDLVSSSFLGVAIINDLIDKLSESSNKLDEYAKTINDISDDIEEELLSLQNESPKRSFFARIKSIFVHREEPIYYYVSLTDEEQDILDGYLQKYKDVDSEIWNYNLEDNLVQSLAKEITSPQEIDELDFPHKYSASVVPELLKESVLPDLQALGLEHLVPKLQEALIEEYKKDLPDPTVYQVPEEDMYLYVPDFSPEATKKHEITEEQLQNILQLVQDSVDSSEKTLKSIKEDKASGGLDLESFEAIDLNVSAPQRKDATQVISSELSNEKKQSNEQVKEQSNDKETSDKPFEKDGRL